MRTFRFRPLDRLEERATPATLADMQWAYATTQANTAFIRAVSSDPGWMANPEFNWIVQRFTRQINQQSDAAQAILSAGPMAAQAEANAAFATAISDLFDFPLVPPVPPPPPNANGMSPSMPDINAPNWQPMANGLKIWDVVTGSGSAVTTGDVATAFYTGWLAANGTQFDTDKTAPAFRFTVGPTSVDGAPTVIAGWQQGIVGMRPGGIRRLYIPAALGYGSTGSGSSIPPNADLVFEVKLISHT